MIIGLTGKRLSGKDTVANYLVAKHGFEHVFFSRKMKEAVAALFDIPLSSVDTFKGDRDDTVEVRIKLTTSNGHAFIDMGWVEFLQRFGTDMGRKVLGEDIWVNYCFVDKTWYHHAEQKYADQRLVVKDVRFNNEAQRILDLGGTIIELRRPLVDKTNDGHESEDGLSKDLVEYVIDNNSSIESLYNDVDAVLENIYAHANSR